jgi:hypothetical protein
VLRLYARLIAEAGQRLVRSWQGLLVLPLYPLVLAAASLILARAGMIGGFLMGFVLAACFASYLEVLSESVTSRRFRLSWPELQRTFKARFWDVVSVLFIFFIIESITGLLAQSSRGPAINAIITLTMAFFFNPVPELLYQGRSRSVALLGDSARFMTEHPVTWLLPNVLLAALAFATSGLLNGATPAEQLLTLIGTLASPLTLLALLGTRLAWWLWPFLIVFGHALMIFRGLLFRELSRGGANPRLEAFRTRMRG